MLRASLSPSDELATNLARAAEPIAIRIGDSPPLILPPSQLIGTYIGQCASGGLTTARSDATGNASSSSNAAAPANVTAAGN